ncbi:MAG: T9SS type A sorting domain-containing protein [Bacteroidetes bacterium]|nr:T9SS type A sorting domain-containing protein [Bacteroidota bacterium]
MKKIYKLAALALLSMPSFAQTTFWTATNYRGAFAPAPTPMWTDTWTEWDPQNKTYPAPTQTITSSITSNTHWTAGNVYLLQGQIYVKNNSTLTIDAGTIILGDKNSVGAGLFITTGSKIDAQGTVNNPIVFTSNQPAGSRNIGDWGGVILMGKASMNAAGDTAHIEGIAPIPETRYGGYTSPDDNDNSGTLKYVRIEFGGYVYQPNKEINGLTFGAVGRGTTIDYVQVSFSNDDAFEWFGGTVECRHLVSYRNLDDDFDTDNGFSGRVQFGLSVRDPQIADNPSVSTSEGFESDNDPSGTTSTPLTSAVFSNMTLIGPYRGTVGATVASGYRRGARIRRNSNEKIFNSIFMDHVNGVMIDGTLCEANATSGALKFKHNILAGNSTGHVTEVVSGSTFNAPAWFGASANDSLATTAGILITPYNYTSPDYRPAGSSPALGGADFSDPAFTGGFVGINEAVSNDISALAVLPNPASATSHIMISFNKSAKASLSMYDYTGKCIAKLATETEFAEGIHSMEFNTTAYSNGIYFITLEVNGVRQTQKVVINN